MGGNRAFDRFVPGLAVLISGLPGQVPSRRAFSRHSPPAGGCAPSRRSDFRDALFPRSNGRASDEKRSTNRGRAATRPTSIGTRCAARCQAGDVHVRAARIPARHDRLGAHPGISREALRQVRMAAGSGSAANAVVLADVRLRHDRPPNQPQNPTQTTLTKTNKPTQNTTTNTTPPHHTTLGAGGGGSRARADRVIAAG